MTSSPFSFADRIRAILETRSLSQKGAAAALGVSPRLVAYWLETPPSFTPPTAEQTTILQTLSTTPLAPDKLKPGPKTATRREENSAK